MEYPKFTVMTFSIFERHLKWLNHRSRETGINRSIHVREAMELLIAKYSEREAKSDETQISSPENKNSKYI